VISFLPSDKFKPKIALYCFKRAELIVLKHYILLAQPEIQKNSRCKNTHKYKLYQLNKIYKNINFKVCLIISCEKYERYDRLNLGLFAVSTVLSFVSFSSFLTLYLIWFFIFKAVRVPFSMLQLNSDFINFSKISK
jgi:hypothetical protein